MLMIDQIENSSVYRNYLLSYLLLCLFFSTSIELIHKPNILEFIESLLSTNLFTLFYLIVFSIFSSIYVFVFNKPIIFCVVHYSYWCILAIISNATTFFRQTPLVIEDFTLIGEATEVGIKYLNKHFIINFFLLFFCIILTLAITIKFFNNIKMSISIFKNKYLNLCSALLFLVAFFVSNDCLFRFGNYITSTISDFDLVNTYYKNGFIYSFYQYTDSFISGINNFGYDINKISEIKTLLNGIESNTSTTFSDNIILIQLESMFDPLKLNGVKFSEDPLKNLRMLSENNSHGEIIVPVVGGGTTQTEFEILTGINIRNLFSKMPYLNLLNHNSVESFANILKNYGYSTTTIHNYFSNFYNRINAYANLGFDTFIPLETISDRSLNNNFWYKDEIIINEIISKILSTKEKDFIFGVTVEAHGPYKVEIDGDIRVESSILTESEKKELENYVNIIKHTDKFIIDLITSLDKIDEDYILIFYGDHLPSLGNQFSTFYKTIDNESDLFKTPYLVVTSDKSKIIDLDKKFLHSYEFIGSILDSLDLSTTIYHKFRTTFTNNENIHEYENQLLMDIKYKNMYHNNTFPYKNGNIKIGNNPPIIDDIIIDDDTIYILGQNFNPNLKVLINKDLRNLEYISSTCLNLSNYVLQPNDMVKLITFSNKNSPLNSGNYFEFKG